MHRFQARFHDENFDYLKQLVMDNDMRSINETLNLIISRMRRDKVSDITSLLIRE